MVEIPGINIVNLMDLKARECLEQISEHLENGIFPFWITNDQSHEYGGYLTCYNDEGKLLDDTDEYIFTQTRMIWGMSTLYKLYPNNQHLYETAKQGIQFFIHHFWDCEYGGWVWKTKKDGTVLNSAKVTYGQVFAIYALSEYTIATKDPIGLEYAEKTFDLLQKYGADTNRGGYYENLESNWEIPRKGFRSSDRKSFDIQMHVMEAFTVLALCSGKEIHLQKLEEVIEFILNKMIDKTSGSGLNQFDVYLNPVPAIDNRRRWVDDRQKGETIDQQFDHTSYGHNLELAWLLARAGEILGNHKKYNAVCNNLVNHALKYFLDQKNGGLYRDGPHEGKPLGKEWWQNSELLVGFLDAFERTGEEKYFDAFYIIWTKYFINHQVVEWRHLLQKRNTHVADIGNQWKDIYHTGRSMVECKNRLERLIENCFIIN